MKEQGEYDAPDEDDRAAIRKEDEEEGSDSDSHTERRPTSPAKNDLNHESDESDSARMELADMQQINPNLVNFTFDKEHGQWCEIELEVIASSTLN